MTKRLHLKAGEVPTLFGENSQQSEWSLWNDLMTGKDSPVDEYGRWRARLMVPIMQGIAEDHQIRIHGQIPTDGIDETTGIMPPRAWKVEPSMRTEGEQAVLVVDQRNSPSLREWKVPSTIPPKALRRIKAIAAAYDVGYVMLGILVDGYSSQLYGIAVPAAERIEIRQRVAEFLETVRRGEEPEIDFTRDESAIRSGTAVAKVEAAAGQVAELVKERDDLLLERAPIDNRLKRIEERLRQIDTLFIHLAGTTGKIETGEFVITVTRNAKDVPTVTVTKKGQSLF